MVLYDAMRLVAEQYYAASTSQKLSNEEHMHYIESLQSLSEELNKINVTLEKFDDENETIGEGVSKTGEKLDISAKAATRLNDALQNLANIDNVDTVISVVRLPSPEEIDKLQAAGYINELKGRLEEQAEKQRLFDFIVDKGLIPKKGQQALADSMGVKTFVDKFKDGVANVNMYIQTIGDTMTNAMSLFGANADVELTRIEGQLDLLRAR